MIKFNTNRTIEVQSDRIVNLIDEIRQDPMGGWFDLPETFNPLELEEIKIAAQQIQSDSKYLVCVGIGGSYLGHRAISAALMPEGKTKLLYAGNSLSPRAFSRLMTELGDSDFSVNVISKSGTTTEPAVAFRLLKAKLHEKYGDSANQRIYATTDAHHGALHDEAVAEGYTRFIVPDNVGGRYSVLSAVGLLPLAAAGIKIDDLLAGAKQLRAEMLATVDFAGSPVAQYATLRAELLREGYDTEILASFEPSLHYFAEWWKQLFGESEGKANQGIFPAAVTYTTDLHSLGQYLQEGRRNIFETVLEFAHLSGDDFMVPSDSDNLDGLNYLTGKNLSELNRVATEATVAAHRAGGLPVTEICTERLDASSMGALVFFFEAACALSAKLSGVNPFDQPGVEAYKTEMFCLLGKPGF